MTREGVWWRAFFLALDRTEGNVTASASLAGVSPRSVYYALESRKRPTFRAEFEATMIRVRERRTRRTAYRCSVAA